MESRSACLITGTARASSVATATEMLMSCRITISSPVHWELRIGYSRSDSTTALMKKGTYDSGRPVHARNSGPACSRSFTRR